MAKWDLSKLPEGRKPLPDEWFAERAQMQERIKELVEALENIRDVAEISEGTQWYAMIAERALTGGKDD